MRSKIEGFAVEKNTATISNLTYVVTYYGVPVGYFTSYGSAVLAVVHWMRDPAAFAFVLDEMLSEEDVEVVCSRLEHRDREEVVKRQRS